MNTVETIARARGASGRGCRYGLGHGGYNPALDHPWDYEMLCDCSGFVAWVLRISRHIDHPWYKSQNGGWLETSAIVRDCGTPNGFFNEVELGLAAVGDLLVYGDHGVGDAKRQGHVGIISEVGPSGPVLAVHCSRGNQARYGDAIRETTTGLWIAANGIVARFAGEG